jgi:hypothetical protein
VRGFLAKPAFPSSGCNEGFLFDDGARDLLVADSLTGRDSAAQISDVMWHPLASSSDFGLDFAGMFEPEAERRTAWDLTNEQKRGRDRCRVRWSR